jgi:tRNA-modifying protein YgfZ
VSATVTVADQVAALRHGTGAYLLARDVFSVRGDDAEAYLQGQLSQDVVALAVGATADSLLLQPDGKLTALLRVTRVDAHGFVLDTDAGFGDTMVARLKKFLLRSKVEIERLEWRGLALRGAGVASTAAGLLTVLEEAGVTALPFEWNGWSGIDLLGPKDVILDPSTGPLPEGIVPCGREAAEACRIASGLPAMGSELTDKTIAAEAGLVEHTVSFTKGCYTGQELIARLDSRGNNVPRRLVGVVGGTDPDGDRLAFGMTLHAGEPPAANGADGADGADVAADKVVGSVTSAAWSPEVGAWVALAYLHRTVEAPGPVRVRSGDGLGGAQAARVALLPLVEPVGSS